MKCTILHDLPGRLRVHLCCGRMSLSQADVLEYYLLAVDGVRSVKHIREGLSALWHGKLSVAVLDATAATVSMARVDSVWRQVNGDEVLTRITDVKPGDRIVIRAARTLI